MVRSARRSEPARAADEAAQSPIYRVGFRGWPTLLKLAGVFAIEVVIVFGYLDHEAIDHYALHPTIAFASVLPLFLLARTLGIEVREELLISYLFLNFARIPDYLFEAGIGHEAWMNVFLLHPAFDEIIGWALPFLTLQMVVLGTAYVAAKLRYSKWRARVA